ncbi:MAG: NADPH:quinone reductase [Acidobacteriota bacterium]
MKAILARSFGGPEVLELAEVPDPVPGPGQVRVRVHAVGVNPYDTYQRAGGYARNPKLPYTPGADGAGIVDAVGDGVTVVSVGDRVYFGGTAVDRSIGAYAELAVCELHQVHPLPERVSFAQGAGVNVPYATAWRALHGRAGIRPGETLFIHGASGGVGLAATQMGRAAGLTVIGTAGTPDGLELVRAQGAHHALNHRATGYLEELAAVTGGRGPDVILEHLANVNLDSDLAAIAPGGRIVIVGNRGRIEIDPRRAMGKEAAILGMSFWNTPADELARIHRGIGAGLELGWLTPVVGTELPLGEAARAHRLIMESGARGKIVLIP